jgi:hypothetical protein
MRWIMSLQDLSKGYIPILLAVSLGIGLTMAGMEAGIGIERMREDHSALVNLQREVADIKQILQAHGPCISGSTMAK